MKRLHTLLLILLISLAVYPQQATKVANVLNVDISDPNPIRFLSCDYPTGGLFKVYLKDDIRWETYNINNLSTYINTIGSGLFKPVSYTPNSAEINTALGYPPYNGAANPLGFLTSYSETDPLFNTKFALKTTGDLVEGSNLYWTSSRFNTAFSSKTTSDLIEGTNLYWTSSRFNTAFGTKTTSDLAEGINLYFTNGRFNSQFSTKTTNDLAEGISNLYYTDTRARASLSAGTSIGYVAATGVITNTAPDRIVSVTASNGITWGGTYPTFTVTKKRNEPYTGTTDSSGVYTLTYPVSFSATPNVQFNIVGGTNKDTILLTSSTTTGCSFKAERRNDVLGLLPSYSNINGAVINILATEY